MSARSFRAFYPSSSREKLLRGYQRWSFHSPLAHIVQHWSFKLFILQSTIPMMSSKSLKDSEAENSVESGEAEEIKFDVEHEIQGLISTMEGDSGVRRRPSRDSSGMRVDEVSEQDIQLTSRLVDNEDQLLAEANFRAATERKSYCFSKKCIWHFVLLSLFVTLIVVGALLVVNSNSHVSAQNSNSAAAGSTIPPAPSNLADICSISAVLNSGGNADDCRAACAPANCCYSQDSTTFPSCYNRFPELCATYMVCLSLESTKEPLPSDTVIPPPVPLETNPPVPIETNPPVPIETNPPEPIETSPPIVQSIKSVVSPPPDNLSYLCDTSNIQSVSLFKNSFLLWFSLRSWNSILFSHHYIHSLYSPWY